MVPAPTTRFLRFGRYCLDLMTDRLLDGESPLAVPPKAISVLKVLVLRRDRAVSKDELFQVVWPDTVVEEANLSQQIFMLRKILGDDPAHPNYISTVPRVGYRFIGEVVTAAEPPAPSSAGVEAVAAPLNARTGTSPPRPWRYLVSGLGGVLVVTMSALAWLEGLDRAHFAVSPPAVTFEVVVPAGLTVSPRDGLAGVSPDGSAFAAVVRRDGETSLWVRPMNQTDGRVLPGSERAVHPFWSPDSRHLGYFADGKLRTISLDGGPPTDLAAVTEPKGGAWLRDDTIVFAPGSRTPLWRVSARGGPARVLTTLNPTRRDVSHRWPNPSPDGERFVFLVWSGRSREQGIFAGTIDGTPPRRVAAAQSPANWVGEHLFYISRETLVAQRFNAARLQTEGELVQVAQPVGRGPNDNAAFAASTNGALSYIPTRYAQELHLLDQAGQQLEVLGGAAQFGDPAMSPDGTRVAFAARHREQGDDNMDLWVHELKTGVRTKLTFDEAVDVLPVWSRDGRELLFRSNRSGVSNLYRKRLDGSPGDETLVLASMARKDPTDWSPDGTTVLFTQFTGAGGTDVWRLRLDGPSQPEPVAAGPGNQSHARFLPDGRYLAYASTESGVADIVVESLADRRRWRAARGSEPQWSNDGKTLFIVGPGGEIQRIAVGRTADALTFGAADTLFTADLFRNLRNAMAASADGRRFVVTLHHRRMLRLPIVMLNWRDSLSTTALSR